MSDKSESDDHRSGPSESGEFYSDNSSSVSLSQFMTDDNDQVIEGEGSLSGIESNEESVDDDYDEADGSKSDVSDEASISSSLSVNKDFKTNNAQDPDTYSDDTISLSSKPDDKCKESDVNFNHDEELRSQPTESQANNESPQLNGAEDIFGEADDLSDDSNKDKELDSPNEGDDECRYIEAEVPKIRLDMGEEIHFVKQLNFISFDPKPFDPSSFEDEMDDDELQDEEGKERLRLKVENTIRWRQVKDAEGNVQKESNTRLVKWSDGTSTLHIGSEVFQAFSEPIQGLKHQLFVRQGTGLHGQAVFKKKMLFKPISTNTSTHRKITFCAANRQRVSGSKMVTCVGANPELSKAEQMKKEVEKLRQPHKPKVSLPKRRVPRFLKDLELSDDESSLLAVKNEYRRKSLRIPSDSTTDDEDFDIVTRKGRTAKLASDEED